MPREFTDAQVSHALISIEDRKGRRASLSFEENELVLRRHRPHQGRKASISYEKLLDLALEDNREFFAIPKPRKRR